MYPYSTSRPPSELPPGHRSNMTPEPPRHGPPHCASWRRGGAQQPTGWTQPRPEGDRRLALTSWYSMQRNISTAVPPALPTSSPQNDPKEPHADGGGELHLRRESSCNILLARSLAHNRQPPLPLPALQPPTSNLPRKPSAARAKATRSMPTESHHQMAAQSNRRSPRSGPKHQAPTPWDRCLPTRP